MDHGKITECTITPSQPSARKYQAEVVATYEDGCIETVVRYYDDELHFAEAEFLGLTREQAIRLFHDKDIAYLQS